jgi:nucleoside-diphosphate-sugar epimerase
MQTVLITGLSGFAGVHAALAFLGEEWKVHGTVRTQEKKDKVLNLLSLKEWVDKKRVEVFIVPELVGGDFTQSLQGVSAVSVACSRRIQATCLTGCCDGGCGDVRL